MGFNSAFKGLSREILEGHLPPLHPLSYACECAYTVTSLTQDLSMKWVLYIVFVSCRVVSTFCSTDMCIVTGLSSFLSLLQWLHYFSGIGTVLVRVL